MALPQIGYPTYELELPSNGKTIKYRPFLVKEEKVLLLALESGDEKQITSAVKDLIKNCVVTKGVRVDQLPIFDLEYLFLRIRGASIGETLNLTVTCLDDGNTQVDVQININDIEVKKENNHSSKIEFDEDFCMVMNYPSMQRFIEMDFLQKELTTDEVFVLIGEGIEQIYKDGEVYDNTTTSKKEFLEFIEKLTPKQFEQIQQFYQTSPKLQHTFSVTNPNTGEESEYVLEGLQSFFV